MRSLLTTLLFVLLFGTLSVSQNSLLWKISGNGLDQPSYLYGTIHIICEEDFAIDSAVMNAINSSNKMVFEVDMSNPAIMQKTQMAMINPERKNLKNDLDESDQTLLDSCLKTKFGAGLDQMGIMKPWALMVTLSVIDMIDCQKTKQYETELLAIAKNQNKTIGELETIDYQFGIFDSIPYQRQLEMLMEGVKYPDKAKSDFKRLEQAYANQDVEEMHQLMMEEDEMKEFGDLFFYNRNSNWIPVIKETIHAETTFFAFGAGHLGGKGGVIDLLKKEGYTIEPIR